MFFREGAGSPPTSSDFPGTHFAGPVVAGVDQGVNIPELRSNAAEIYGAALSSPPGLKAVGDDTNIGIQVKSKGTGTVELVANGLSRFIANPVAKTIVDGSATSLFDVACAASEMVGGFIDFLVRAGDGTDFQALAGRAAYAVVNKAATLTGVITYTTAPEAKAVSSGTLTLAFTIVTGTNKMTVKVQPTGSLTETTYTIEYNVQPIRGAVTIV
jgi:hypothetical protein